MVTVLVNRWLWEMERRFNMPRWGLGMGEHLGLGEQVWYRGKQGQDHRHYFIANEERGGHLPACVHVDRGKAKQCKVIAE